MKEGQYRLLMMMNIKEGRMGKTKKLREHLQSLLESTTELTCYYEQAKKRNYPYLVYSLDCFRNGFRSDYTLEINLWDKNTSLNIEDKADLLEKELDGYTHIDENMQISIYMETRNNVSDPDVSIRRRRLTFSLCHYERGNI